MADSKQLDNVSIRERIEELCAIQDEYREAKAKADNLKKQLDQQSAMVLHALKDFDSDSAKAAGFATVSIDRKEVPTVDNWDQLSEFIRKNDALYLFQRRLNASAVRELKETLVDQDVPGISMFTKEQLRITRL